MQTGFDDAGKILTQTYPDGELVTTGYTPQGWLSSVTSGGAGITGFGLLSKATYSGPGGAAGLLTGATLGGGAYQYGATYDLLLRATDLKTTNGAGTTTFFDQARTFDAAGNVTSATTTLPGGPDTQGFCYDEQNRLTWAGSTGTPPCSVPVTPQSALNAFSQSFTYDALGRLTSGPPGNYTYGDGAHLHAVTAITAGTVTRYSAGYDAAGNMTCRDSQGAECPGYSGAALFYNAPGSLVSWENNSAFPTAGSDFLYDNQGNRVEQVVSGSPTTTVYVGNLEEVTTSGSTTAVTSFYYAGPLRIATAFTGVVSYLASDGLGSASVALNASGPSTASQLFAPYGGARYSSGSMPTDYGFTGQHSDSTSGLDYYVSRY